MKIERIQLANFRGFERFEMDLHPQCTLLVGENGAGKTALVDALTMAVGLSLHHANVPIGPKREESDIRTVVFDVGGVPDLQRQEPLEIFWDVQHEGRVFSIAKSDHWSQLQQTMGSLRTKVEFGQPAMLPLVACYPAQRGWSRKVKTSDTPQLESRWDGYLKWWDPAFSQQQFLAWFVKYTNVALQEQRSVPQLDAVKHAIIEAIPGAKNIEYRMRYAELRVTFEDGRLLNFSQLSDGFRNMLAMVGDIAWRAAVLNPQCEDRAAQETEGIVIVDEIELHLHPRWQRQILGTLTRTFPKLQFILTTHSPQVIASARPEWVRLLTGGPEAQRVEHVHGWDSNSVLEGIMGAGERPPETIAVLRRLAEHIDREQWPEARQCHDELAADLGFDDPELVQARWMMDIGRPGAAAGDGDLP